jgi:hypothetical protein
MSPIPAQKSVAPESCASFSAGLRLASSWRARASQELLVES